MGLCRGGAPFKDPNHTPAYLNKGQPPPSGTRESFIEQRQEKGQELPRAAGTTCCCRKPGRRLPPALPSSPPPGRPLLPSLPSRREPLPGCGTQKNGRRGGRGKPGDSRNPPPPGGGGRPRNLAAPACRRRFPAAARVDRDRGPPGRRGFGVVSSHRSDLLPLWARAFGDTDLGPPTLPHRETSSVRVSLCCPGRRRTGGVRPEHPVLDPAIAEGPRPVHPKRARGGVKPGVRAFPHGRGETASHCAPRPPSCCDWLRRVLHSANQWKVTPFHTPLEWLSAPRPRCHPQHSPHCRTVPKPLTNLPSVRHSPRERARGLWGPGTALLPPSVRASKPGEPQPPVPLQWMERRPTTQPSGCRQSLRASPPCPELPLAGRPDHLARPAAPLASPPLSGLVSPAAGQKGAERAPPFPIPNFLEGSALSPTPDPQTPPGLRGEDAATHRALGSSSCLGPCCRRPFPRSPARQAPAHE